MTAQTFFKGLGMVLVGILITYFSTTPIDFVMMAIAAISAILVYTGKNLIAVLNSTSPATSLNWVNVVSGLLIALGTAILNYVAQYLIESTIDWTLLTKMVVGVTLTYLGSVFFSPPSRESKKLFK
jgi:undecaprenyl pyrophosphate phosphatase UppP